MVAGEDDVEHSVPLVSGGTLLPEATVSGGTVFPEATVSGETLLPEATVSEGTVFPEATVSGGTVFPEATVSGGTLLPEAMACSCQYLSTNISPSSLLSREWASYGDVLDDWDLSLMSGVAASL